MSSNIKITRICRHCGHEFVAKTTVTKYCGEDCAKRAYKARIKKQKIEKSEIETQKAKEFTFYIHQNLRVHDGKGCSTKFEM
jgi:hypothetical protein